MSSGGIAAENVALSAKLLNGGFSLTAKEHRFDPIKS